MSDKGKHHHHHQHHRHHPRIRGNKTLSSSSELNSFIRAVEAEAAVATVIATWLNCEFALCSEIVIAPSRPTKIAFPF
ncbi:hypothetical protein BLOT_015713 [Blomia tropicalis]|nr:hypothetical protein BLOT_015713 [Blomia tropicalis]